MIAYDRDAAGETAAAKLAERLLAEGIECFRVQFPRGMDANEYALKVTPAEKSLALLLHSATWLGKGTARRRRHGRWRPRRRRRRGATAPERPRRRRKKSG